MDEKTALHDAHSSNMEQHSSNNGAAERPQDSEHDEEEGVVITQVDDLIIKSYPDGSTVVIRPDGLQLRQDQDNTSTVIVGPEDVSSTTTSSTVPEMTIRATDVTPNLSGSGDGSKLFPARVVRYVQEYRYEIEHRLICVYSEDMCAGVQPRMCVNHELVPSSEVEYN